MYLKIGVFSVNNVLFEVPKEVSEQEIRDRVSYFISKTEEASNIFENDKTSGKALAKELRDELREEYKNNNKVKTRQFYSDHPLFKNYQSAVQDSYVKTVGALDKGQKTSNFLFDVQSYMNFHFYDS